MGKNNKLVLFASPVEVRRALNELAGELDLPQVRTIKMDASALRKFVNELKAGIKLSKKSSVHSAKFLPRKK